MARQQGFFSKLKSSLLGSSIEQEEERGKFAPKVEQPLDEKFVSQFTEGGGNFMYCPSKEDAIDELKLYAEEQGWDIVGILNKRSSLRTHMRYKFFV